MLIELVKPVLFRFMASRGVSFHFVHLFNTKDLRQIGKVCEMK
jgi:hypothetical protein